MPKKTHEFQNFGEYLYYAYANLQMLHYALKDGKPRYDRICYVICANAFKAYMKQAPGTCFTHLEDIKSKL